MPVQRSNEVLLVESPSYMTKFDHATARTKEGSLTIQSRVIRFYTHPKSNYRRQAGVLGNRVSYPDTKLPLKYYSHNKRPGSLEFSLTQEHTNSRFFCSDRDSIGLT